MCIEVVWSTDTKESVEFPPLLKWQPIDVFMILFFVIDEASVEGICVVTDC